MADEDSMSDTSDDDQMVLEDLPPKPLPPIIHYRDQFTVSASSQSPSRLSSLQGDKILLPPSALEALLSAASRARQHPSQASSYGFHGSGSNADRNDGFDALPQPLTFKLSSAAGKFVYAGIREFSADEGEVVLSPYLTAALFGDDALDAAADTTGASLTVAFAPLPKGTFVHLRPLAAGYNPGDWRALLERQLRKGYTTLTRGAAFTVTSVGAGSTAADEFRFRVDGFKPEGDGICVVDTDLEVDIEALDEEQARETMRQIQGTAESETAGSAEAGTSTSSGGDIDIWKPVDGQVRAGDYVDFELKSWDRSRPLSIILSGFDDSDDTEKGFAVDLLVSAYSARQRVRPRETEHIWASFGVADTDGTKSITLQPQDGELEAADALYISVHGWREAASSRAHRFTLRAKVVLEEEGGGVAGSTASAAAVQGAQPAEANHGPDEEQCKNCLQWVPSRTMVLHENFCLRNNAACPECKQVFQKRSAAWAGHWHCEFDPDDGGRGSSAASKHKHSLIYHPGFLSADLLYACPAETCVGVVAPFTSLPDLARHRTTACPSKLILCQFCQLEVPQEGDPSSASADAAATRLTGQTPHERADGARTTDCYLCGAIVRMRDMRAHLQHHDLDRQKRVVPKICRDVHCGRTLYGVGPKGQIKLRPAPSSAGVGAPANDLNLCASCYAPLYVSMHDPDGRALKRRVERRYMTQLLTGCGKAWCANAWCKTGRANQKMAPIEGGIPAILPRVRPLVADVVGDAGHEPTKDVFFCVDEEAQKRRAVAELLVAQSGNGYDLAWCVAACEAEGADAARAWEWLANWAPRSNEV